MDTKLPLFIGQTLSHSLGRPTEVFGQWLEVHRANLQGHGWKIARLERHLPNRSMLGMERYVVSGNMAVGLCPIFLVGNEFLCDPCLAICLGNPAQRRLSWFSSAPVCHAFKQDIS